MLRTRDRAVELQWGSPRDAGAARLYGRNDFARSLPAQRRLGLLPDAAARPPLAAGGENRLRTRRRRTRGIAATGDGAKGRRLVKCRYHVSEQKLSKRKSTVPRPPAKHVTQASMRAWQRMLSGRR